VLGFRSQQTPRQFMYTEHYWTYLWYLTLTIHGYIFDWNTPAAGHKQRTVGFPQCNLLRRSNSNSTVTICTILFVGKYFSWNLKERVNLGSPGVDGRKILRRIFMN